MMAGIYLSVDRLGVRKKGLAPRDGTFAPVSRDSFGDSLCYTPLRAGAIADYKAQEIDGAAPTKGRVRMILSPAP